MYMTWFLDCLRLLQACYKVVTIRLLQGCQYPGYDMVSRLLANQLIVDLGTENLMNVKMNASDVIAE